MSCPHKNGVLGVASVICYNTTLDRVDTGRKRRPGTAGKDRYEERRDQGVLVEDGDGSTNLLFDTSRKRWMGTAGRGE